MLELITAIALSTLVMLMVASTVATSVRAAGDTTIDMQQGRREDRARALLAAQMGWIEIGPDRTVRRFVGGTDGMELNTLMSARAPQQRLPTRVRIVIAPEAEDREGVRLLYYEWADSRQIDPDADALEQRVLESLAVHATQGAPAFSGALLDDCASITIEYLMIVGSGQRVWDAQWRDPRTMPRAIRIAWTKNEEGGSGEWIVPVVATF